MEREHSDEIDAFDLGRYDGASKLMPLADAIRLHVRPGMSVHLCWSEARPNAALMEIARQFGGRAPVFEVSCVGFANSQAVLVGAKLARKLITAYAGESYPAGGVNPMFQKAIDIGDVEIENWSQWTLVQRLMAAALGLPFMPTRSLGGSGIAAEHSGKRYARVEDPFGAGSVGVVAPHSPDIAILQGVAADPSGNVVMSAPYGEGHWGALASRGGVIACVESIIPATEIRRMSALVRVPAHAVVALCHVPFGSHPYGSATPVLNVPAYVEDADFIGRTAKACRNEANFAAWFEEWVSGVPDHQAYLAKLGQPRLNALVAAADPERWRDELASGTHSAVARHTAEEAMIVVSARMIAERVKQAGYKTVLAGVGASNLACWLAEGMVRADGSSMALMSEIGIYGYAPRPGEPFVFSSRNIAAAQMLTEVSMTLGTLVSGGNNSCLGAFGAASIDTAGNVATTYDQDGKFVVGSGGANDIASAARETLVTVKHSPRRLVKKIEYVTSPGDKVRTIVTSRAIMSREGPGQPFVLVGVIPEGDETTEDAVAAARAGCGWKLEVAGNPFREAPPTEAELRRLRLFDPQRVFLGNISS
jgi:acyl CoA:acetate/3-ketoacid CoA transferase alpha subunit/acyl CoA:acetate/3-ketoacid CoA transferase beta subunit